MPKDLIEEISEKKITLEDVLNIISNEIDRSNLEDFLISVIEKVIKNQTVKKECESEAKSIVTDILNEGAPISILKTMLNFLLNYSAEEEEKSYKALQAQSLIRNITHKNKFFNGSDFKKFTSLIKDVGANLLIPQAAA
ncbi:MAG: hypothetical protein SFV53_03300 [Rickettsiales bacterium]|nr:hypothetical protein [Rickettsiales bacterium]